MENETLRRSAWLEVDVNSYIKNDLAPAVDRTELPVRFYAMDRIEGWQGYIDQLETDSYTDIQDLTLIHSSLKRLVKDRSQLHRKAITHLLAQSTEELVSHLRKDLDERFPDKPE